MFCSIYKLYISWVLDGGKEIPARVNRHIDGCASCRNYLRIHHSLDRGISADAAEVIKQTPASLPQDIIMGLNTSPAPRYRPPRRKMALLPVMGYAALLLIIASGVLLLNGPGVTPPANNIELPGLLDNFADNRTPQKALATIFTSAENPYNKELQSLKEAAQSTTAFFTSYLDIQIDNKKDES